MTYQRSQSKLPVKPGLEPRSLTLKPVLYLWIYLNQNKQKNPMVTGVLSDPVFCFPDPEILHLENDHTCPFSLCGQETLF